MADLEISTERGPMPAYCAVPTTASPWPGVVVVHDFTGMSHDLRARRLCTEVVHRCRKAGMVAA